MKLDILRQLSETEVDELQQLYLAKCGPLDFHYLLLYNQRKWDRQLRSAGIADDDLEHRSLRRTFYTRRDVDFRRHGTYVSLQQDLQQSVAFFSWQQPEPSDLYECLERTQLIEWRRGALLINVHPTHCVRVKAIALAGGAAAVSARQCHGYTLANEQARKLQAPEPESDFELRPLRLEEAAVVHSVWPHASEGSLDFIRALVRYNRTLGACRSDTGELIAWIFQNDFAGLGLLQVLPKVERRGLGGLLAAAMSRAIGKAEPMTLTAWIVASNWRSEALLKRIGYKKTADAEWITLLGDVNNNNDNAIA